MDFMIRVTGLLFFKTFCCPFSQILQVPEFKQGMDRNGITNGTAFCESIRVIGRLKEENHSTAKAKNWNGGEVSVTVANSECYDGVDRKTVEHSGCSFWVKTFL